MRNQSMGLMRGVLAVGQSRRCELRECQPCPALCSSLPRCATPTFKGARLNGSELAGADFQGADVTDADFDNAEVTSTRLIGLRGRNRGAQP